MTNQHLINLSEEVLDEWRSEYNLSLGDKENYAMFMAEKAAQWGADQELEACCNYFEDRLRDGIAKDLRTTRRPKPSLKEQALALLDKAEDPSWDINDFSIIRQALEALPND